MRIIPKIPLTLEEIAKSTPSITNYKNNSVINAITTNSKEVKNGDIFIALSGEHADGEEYTKEAKDKGAYIISSKDINAEFKVKDTVLALLDIASYYKTKLSNLKKTVAVTRSVGKTTTKNILSKMLGSKFKVHATEENYNNFLGVSYTLLSASENTEFLIVELGMNHLGEIAALSKAVKPDIGIITNIGSSHIGNLGSRELIAKAKLEITEGMSKQQLIVPYEEELLSTAEGIYTVSLENPKADCFIFQQEADISYSVFDIYTSKYELPMQRLSLSGRHVLNAIAFSVEVLDLLNIKSADIKEALSALDTACVRGKFINVADITVYDDTYSSSPEAVLADFGLLFLDKSTTKSCVLGDMLELGSETEKLHKKIGRAVFEYGFKNLFAFGVYAPFIAEGAVSAGMNKENVFINTDITAPEITAKQILDNHVENEIILFKASHNIHAERIYSFLESLAYKNTSRKG